ncbi:MAG: mercury transporter MerC [Gammaproteobacteria bacterium]|nr:MAG: mercury transporter MerC [Gammaproteobacteria bacterium]
MNAIAKKLAFLGDKVGTLGAIVAAMGCSMCFPALAGLAGVLGLSFLSRWEGIFINTLLPFFAWLTLVLNVLGWFAHRQWQRTLLGMIGPTLLLLSLYPWFQYAWSTYVTYSALAIMVMVSIWDLFSTANRRCDGEGQCIQDATNDDLRR